MRREKKNNNERVRSFGVQSAQHSTNFTEVTLLQSSVKKCELMGAIVRWRRSSAQSLLERPGEGEGASAHAWVRPCAVLWCAFVAGARGGGLPCRVRNVSADGVAECDEFAAQMGTSLGPGRAASAQCGRNDRVKRVPLLTGSRHVQTKPHAREIFQNHFPRVRRLATALHAGHAMPCHHTAAVVVVNSVCMSDSWGGRRRIQETISPAILLTLPCGWPHPWAHRG